MNEKEKNEKIVQLRNQRWEMFEIQEYFKKSLNIAITLDDIREACQDIKVVGRRKNVLTEISDEELYNLREQLWSCQKIAEYFNNERGIPVTSSIIYMKCKEIYEARGEEEPTHRQVDIPEDDLKKLIKKGYLYKEIVSEFEKKGIYVTEPYLRQYIRKQYNANAKRSRKIQNAQNNQGKLKKMSKKFSPNERQIGSKQ